MTEETKPNETIETTPTDDAKPAPAPEPSRADVRKDPLFQKLANELKALKDERVNAAKAAEEDKLRKAQDFESLEAKLKAELEAERTARERERTEWTLRSKLAEAGARDLALDGAIARYHAAEDKPEVDAYVASLVEQGAFAAPATPAAKPPPGGTVNTRSAKTDWKTARADLADPAKAKAVSEAVTRYVAEHGTMPEGF